MSMTTVLRRRSAAVCGTGARGAVTLLAALLIGGCADLDIVNTNAPTVGTLTDEPSREVLALAATGIFAQTFNDVGNEIQFYALYGREGYNLLGNDPRETGEQIRGPQDPTGRNSGIWLGPYAGIRTINTYLTALQNSFGLSAQELRASAGFAKTLKAWHIHRLAVRSGGFGIPLDVDRPITATPAPFVSFADALAAASALMDEGLADLQAGGGAFPFTVGPGFTGFGTPATFAQFNRALAAKILVHRATFVNCTPCWAEARTALNASFMSDAGLPESLATGVYHAFSAAAGEPSNPVTEPLANNRLWVHPSIMAGAQLQPDGAPDRRLTQKVLDTGRARTLNDLTGTHKPVLYNNAENRAAADLGADVPWIINEELLLLRAEVRWHTNDRGGAIADLNAVRLHAGGLAPSGLTAGSADNAFVDELLYNRLYSLMWSQGTRWIDARRYGRLGTLPVDRPGDSVFESMIVPAAECDARGLESPCSPLTQQ
jgi:starch-binding outer membrane protein, SusD/RagB family